MGVYIKGMEMPNRGHTTTITIVGSGQAYVEYFDCRPHVEETIEYTAVPVPQHGRLIDADEFFKALTMDDCVSILEAMHIQSILSDVPTIIPAEEVDNGT